MVHWRVLVGICGCGCREPAATTTATAATGIRLSLLFSIPLSCCSVVPFLLELDH